MHLWEQADIKTFTNSQLLYFFWKHFTRNQTTDSRRTHTNTLCISEVFSSPHCYLVFYRFPPKGGCDGWGCVNIKGLAAGGDKIFPPTSHSRCRAAMIISSDCVSAALRYSVFHTLALNIHAGALRDAMLTDALIILS